MRCYWCRTCGRDGMNFGDRLGPALLEAYGAEVVWAAPGEAQIVTAGSVLSKFDRRYKGIVLGTGYIRADMDGRLPHARILAVRGELTRVRARVAPTTPLGDPGVLIRDLIARLPTQAEFRGDTVIVPHYVDTEMRARHPDARYVDICGPIASVIAQIACSSRAIVSTLHGLIAADVLGVPHTLELAATTGGLFKFTDYASALGETISEGVERLTPRPAMREAQARLRALFSEAVR